MTGGRAASVEIGLGLVVPATGARADVLVRAAAGTRLVDVAPALLARVLPDGGTGMLCTGAGPLPATAVLGEPPLVEGVLLTVDAPPAPRTLPARFELHCTGGPDAGGVWPLTPGERILGRGVTAGIRVEDPDLSREHCRLRLEHDGWATVQDLASTNGSRLDGAPLAGEPVTLPLGAVLRIGESSFVLRPPSEPPVPVVEAPDGRLDWNRPPRVRPPRRVVQVVLPAPLGDHERTPWPVLAVVAPVLLGVVLWQVLGNATFLLFTLLSPVLVLGAVVTEKRSGRRRSRRERALWAAQRATAETTLHAAVREDERLRRQADPDPAQVALTALGPRPRLWERRRDDDDLLHLRLGSADQRAEVEVEGEVPADDTTARAVPLVVPLTAAGVLGLAGPRHRAQALARWLVVQAAVWHSPRDLQVVVLAEPSAAGDWSWVRWLPHVRPDAGQDCRALLGFGPAQAAARVRELSALVAARRAQCSGAAEHRRVLLVVDGARALRAVPGLAALLAEGPQVDVHAVTVESDPRLLPEECGATAVVVGATGTRLDVRLAGAPPLPDVPADHVCAGYAERVARALAPLRDDSRDGGSGAAALPTTVRWTDVADLALTGGPGDTAGVLDRWAFPGRSTTAVLGCGPDGTFAVDLRRDGPHALVAGTTGSGKSELLQSLIASLAMGNRPDELTFVLVDYKGGAAFGPCARLPHVVGLVTDLDGALVERALASLGAELTRREAVLAAAGAYDVEEHRRRVGTPGGPDRVLPRLVLVVDEFASLAEELPEFVGGLVAIAQRGRSLGVHLVLATQRPEGVVSADIRANTNLRLCLAVTRDTESRDVLDSPLAATIARTTPGRGYARTGHGELTAFQAGRVGGRRPGARAGDPAPSVEVLPAALLGDPVPRTVRVEASDDVTDLSLLVDACVEAAARLAVPVPRSPWLAALPALVVRHDVPAPVDPLAGSPGRVAPLVYGLLDVPGEQARRPLALDLDRGTHLMVVGAPRTGRTTVLRTLAGAVAATASPDDLHLYALDLGGGLAGLADLPHTGAVVSRDQPERMDRVLTWLAAEVSRRSAVLADGGHAGLAEQRAAVPRADRLPHLLLMLDRWEAFLAAFQDLDAGRLVELVHRLLREGPSAGLHVVLTADRSGLTGRVSTMIEDTLLLRLVDRGDYAAAGVPHRLVPDDLPAGRGFRVQGAPLLAQVALLAPEPTGPAQQQALKRLAAAAATPARRPRRVELLPAAVDLATVPRPAGARCTTIVLGVGGDELEPVLLDLAGHPPGLLVAGPPRSGRSTTLLTVAAGWAGTGLPVVALAPRPSPLRELPGCLTSRDNAVALQQRLGAGPCLLLVDDAELLVDSGLSAVLERAVREARDSATFVVAAGTTEALVAGFRGFVVDLRRSRCGLLLCPQGPADGDLLGVRLSRATGGDVVPGRGLLAVRGGVQPVQVAVVGLPGAGTGKRLEQTFEHLFTSRGATVVDQDAVTSNPEKDPSDWVTGDEPVTGPQQSYLSTLAQQAGEQVDSEGLSKAEASQKIDELQDKAGN